ncbi:hypothetical protein ACFL01_00510 [Planctomycetota bacterium]
MRSIWYLIAGRPVNLDDCLHLAGSVMISSVSMELRVYRSLWEMFLVTQYAVRLTWRFSTGGVTHEKIFAGDTNCMGEVRKASIDKANCCLEQVIERIERTGICVQGGEKRFTQPISCDIIRTPRWI